MKHGRFVSYKYFEEDELEVLDTEYSRVVISEKPEIKRQVKGIHKNGLANGEYEIIDNDIVVEKGFLRVESSRSLQIWIPPTNMRSISLKKSCPLSAQSGACLPPSWVVSSSRSLP